MPVVYTASVTLPTGAQPTNAYAVITLMSQLPPITLSTYTAQPSTTVSMQPMRSTLSTTVSSGAIVVTLPGVIPVDALIRGNAFYKIELFANGVMYTPGASLLNPTPAAIPSGGVLAATYYAGPTLAQEAAGAVLPLNTSPNVFLASLNGYVDNCGGCTVFTSGTGLLAGSLGLSSPPSTYTVFTTLADGLVPKNASTLGTLFLRSDGTWQPIASGGSTTAFTGATSATPGALGLVPAPAISPTPALQYLSAAGTWLNLPTFTPAIYQGATATTAGVVGYVPSAATNQLNYYLAGDGTWKPVPSSPAVMTGATALTAGTSGLTPIPPPNSQAFYLAGDGTWKALPAVGATAAFTPSTLAAAGSQGLVPAPPAGSPARVLAADGTWVSLPASSTAFTGSTSGANGGQGLVPAPPSAPVPSNLYLSAAGSWTTLPAATPVYVGATSVAPGVTGTVPAATSTDRLKFLRGDGTFQDVGTVFGYLSAPTALADGAGGLVPAPLAGQQTFILSASGWIAQTPPPTPAWTVRGSDSSGAFAAPFGSTTVDNGDAVTISIDPAGAIQGTVTAAEATAAQPTLVIKLQRPRKNVRLAPSSGDSLAPASDHHVIVTDDPAGSSFTLTDPAAGEANEFSISKSGAVGDLSIILPAGHSWQGSLPSTLPLKLSAGVTSIGTAPAVNVIKISVLGTTWAVV